MKKIFTITIVLALLLSCTKDAISDTATSLDGIVATASDFCCETKTSISQSLAFSWAEGDEIGVVPMNASTFQTNYEIKTIGADPKTASFDGGAWKLKAGNEYSAYYPCQNVVLTSDGSLNLSFQGQKQSANNTLSHIGPYDYMYASAVSPADGKATFSFHHLVSLLQITVPIKQTGIYSNLALKAGTNCFAKGAILSAEEGTLNATSRSSQIELQLNNLSMREGEDLIAWLSILPTTLPQDTELTVILETPAGDQMTYDIDSSITDFQAGKAYALTAHRDSKVIFSDNFNWLSEFIPNSCADFVNGTYDDLATRISYSNNNSVNLYSTYPDTFPGKLSKAGYSDAKASNKVMYGQGTKDNPYMKFCKGDTQTALVMQPFSQSYDKVTISMDWAVHMTSSNLDESDLQLRIEGGGYFSNGLKVSNQFELKQKANENPQWSHAEAEITSVDSSTKILISTKQAFEGNYAASGQHRFYLDNIRITTDNGFDNDPVSPESGSTVYGVVKCGNKGVANVVISDGYEVVKTDSDGVYQLKSKKKNGYVFMSVPSGYEAASDGVLPLFHKRLVKGATSVERADFELFDVGDQTNHTILYLGDMHLANRNKDRAQFKEFTTEIEAYRNQHPQDKIYGITLGDMTWDLYWYSKSYCFEQYINEYSGVLHNMQIYHCIGNHDHDMNATGDWDTVLRFRDAVCPNYYSFNIGKIHYFSIDDIECTNTPASKTDGSGRSYNESVVSDIISWIKKDLSYVAKTTPIVIAMHAPMYNKDGGNGLKNVDALTTALSGYNVTFVTGHTHVCYTVNKSSSITEYNSGAICAAWWWAGKYSSGYNIATDGSPSGYRITSVKGTKQESYFKAVGRSADYQFRTYDRNKINFDLSMVPQDARQALMKELALTLIYGNYSGGSSSNDVIINVWDWNKNWKVEVTENGKALEVKQKTLMDPSFFIAYTLPHLNNNNTSVSWHPSATNHMFVATASSASSTLNIKVTDDEGRVYTESMKRPKEFKIENYK